MPPDGEALSEEVLTDLGIDPDPRWAVNKIDSAELVSPSGKVVEITQGSAAKIGYILDRKVFDQDLAIRAVKAGSDIKVDAFVDGLAGDGEVEGVTFSSDDGKKKVGADIVIAADGIMSKVARWVGFDTELGATGGRVLLPV